MDHLGPDPVPVWDASTAVVGITCCSIVLAFNPLFISIGFFILDISGRLNPVILA